MEPSFNEMEKRFVLAEMIKASHMDVNMLVDFVKSSDIQPDWLSMQLPGGRNLNQCLRAAEVMFNAQFQPPIMPPLKRKSLGDLQEHFPKRLAVMPSSVEPSPSPYQQSPRNIQPQPLHIQPRPVLNGPNGYPPTASPVATTTPTAGPGRRRGRPPKADKDAQARANASLLPTTYAPISPAPPPPPQAPIAPAPSHHPAGGPPTAAYSISTPSSHELKPKRKPRQSGGGGGGDGGSAAAATAANIPRSAVPNNYNNMAIPTTTTTNARDPAAPEGRERQQQEKRLDQDKPSPRGSAAEALLPRASANHGAQARDDEQRKTSRVLPAPFQDTQAPGPGRGPENHTGVVGNAAAV